jgi:hypothetical protein
MAGFIFYPSNEPFTWFIRINDVLTDQASK